MQSGGTKRPSFSFRTVFWSAAALAVAVLLVFAFRPRPVAVDLAGITRGPMQVTVRDEGRTRIRNEYIVSAPVGGHLLRIGYKPGATVDAGDVVARILPGAPAFLDARAQAEARAGVNTAAAALAAARAEVERAEAQAGFARMELQRTTELHARELIPVETHDRARLALQVAQSALDTARESVRMRDAELEAARIRLTQPGGEGEPGAIVEVVAPVAGSVLRVAQESESVIAAGAEVVSLGDPADLEVVVEMLSTDAVHARPGAEVILENWGRADEPLHGRVRLVEPYGFLKISALGVEEQRVNVIVDFTGPPSAWSSLGHGYRVEAAIVTWRADDVVQVPVASLFRSGGKWAVFRATDGRAELTPVEVGRDNGRQAQVLAGLEAGDTVILYPGETLADGVRVERRNAP
jgi:HlyD family secretion protein